MRRLKKLLILIFIFNSICLSSYTIKETLKEIKSLKKEILKKEKIVDEKINEFKKTNPILADKGSFESSTEYEERFKKGQQIIDDLRSSYIDNLCNDLNMLRERTSESNKIKLTLGEYDPDTKIYPIKLKHLQYSKEEYELEIRLSSNKAEILYNNRNNIEVVGKLILFIGDEVVLSKVDISEPISGLNFQHEFKPSIKLFNNYNQYKFSSASFSSDGKFVAIGSDPNLVMLYDLEKRQNVASYSLGSLNGEVSVTFSKDNKFLIADIVEITKVMRGWHESEEIDTHYFIFDTISSKNRKEVIKSNNQIYSIGGEYICSIDENRDTSSDGKYKLKINEQLLTIYQNSNPKKLNDTENSILNPPSLSSLIEFRELSGNQYLDALETCEIKLTLTNSGKGTAKGISIKFEPERIESLNYNNSYIEEIPAGESVTISIPIEAYIDVKDETHLLRINFDEINGFPPAPVELQISTKSYKKPKMFIADVGIQDGNNDGKIESGEMIELTLRFANKGKGLASGTYAKFYSGDNVFITDAYPKAAKLGDLEYGEFVDINLEFFVNDRTIEEIPLFVDITESTNLATVNKLRIPILKSDKTREIHRTVIAGLDKEYGDFEFGDDLSIDIEQYIPQTLKKNNNALAIIFGIEDYKNISDVSFAHRDARFIKEYFNKTLGVKKSNIHYKTNDDVSKAEFDLVFSEGGWLNKRVKVGITEIYFYYAGHGAPDIKENKAYLIPYDGDPNYASQTGYEIEEIYDNLANLNAKSVTVFLDACFTGANRESEMLLANARPLMIEVESPIAKGITVFSATGQKEISSAWPEKKHGLFSYYLMKGMQGEADMNNDKKLTIKELGDYINEKVSEQAGYLDREQTPQMISNDENRILINY